MFRLSLPSVACIVAYVVVLARADDPRTHHEYCVIGAGPGGLQISYFLQKAGRDYITYEKGKYAISIDTMGKKTPFRNAVLSIYYYII